MTVRSEPASGAMKIAPRWLRILWGNGKSRAGLILVGLFFVVAIFAPEISPYDPRSTNFGQSQGVSLAHPLGTTNQGQDVLSQLIVGTRTSVIVGLVAGLLVTAIAAAIGLLAGYLQGIVDELLSLLINIAIVIPTLPLMIAIASYSPVHGVTLIVFVIALTGWAGGARIKRAQIITLRTREYITAAKFAGDRTFRILFWEIVPNMASLIAAAFLGAAGGAIGAEAGLEFLGLGDPTTISWGTMLYWADNGGALVTGQWGWLIAPGIALAALISSFVLINFGVDALSNPALREK